MDAVAEIEGSLKGELRDFKKEVADAVISVFEPVQAKYQDLIDDKSYLEGVLQSGADAAQKRAYKVLGKVYRKAGCRAATMMERRALRVHHVVVSATPILASGSRAFHAIAIILTFSVEILAVASIVL